MNLEQLIAMADRAQQGTTSQELPDDAIGVDGLVLDQYARLSVNPYGVKDSVPRQLRQLDRLAPMLPYTIGQTFKDDGKSAYDESKPRPDFEKLIARMQKGESSGVLCVALDRLLRNLGDMHRLVKLGQEAASKGRRLFVVTPYGSSDLANNEHIYMLYMQAVNAWKQSADASRRIRSVVSDRYESGKPFPYGKRPYGFERDHITLRRTESDVIREAGMAFLRGVRWRHIAGDLNSRGIKTVAGYPFSSQTVRQLVLRPSNAGLLSTEDKRYRGRRLDMPETIFSLDEYEDLLAMASVRNSARPQKSNEGKYLLTGGLLICGRCGSRMYGRTRLAPAGYQSYTCGNQNVGERSGRKGYRNECGSSMTISLPKTDDLVRAYVVAKLAAPEHAHQMAAALGSKREEQANLAAERARYEEMLAELAENLDIPTDVLSRRSRAIKSKLEDISRQISLAEVRSLEHGAETLRELANRDVAASWDGDGSESPAVIVADRRSMVAAVVKHFVIKPGRRGVFQPERIVPVRHDGTEELIN